MGGRFAELSASLLCSAPLLATSNNQVTKRNAEPTNPPLQKQISQLTFLSRLAKVVNRVSLRQTKARSRALYGMYLKDEDSFHSSGEDD